MARAKNKRTDTTANLGLKAKLWAAADALRNNMDAAEYKHVVLRQIFLKYISDAFEAKHSELEAQAGFTTWRLAKMNLAIRDIDAQIAHGDTFHRHAHPDLKADVIANPPFNGSDWRGDLRTKDAEHFLERTL